MITEKTGQPPAGSYTKLDLPAFSFASQVIL